MAKVTLTNNDGSTEDFNDQAYTDAAVAAALAAQPLVPDVQGVSLEDLQKAEADAQVVVSDVAADEAKEPEVPVVEAPVEPSV